MLPAHRVDRSRSYPPVPHRKHNSSPKWEIFLFVSFILFFYRGHIFYHYPILTHFLFLLTEFIKIEQLRNTIGRTTYSQNNKRNSCILLCDIVCLLGCVTCLLKINFFQLKLYNCHADSHKLISGIVS